MVDENYKLQTSYEENLPPNFSLKSSSSSVNDGLFDVLPSTSSSSTEFVLKDGLKRSVYDDSVDRIKKLKLTDNGRDEQLKIISSDSKHSNDRVSSLIRKLDQIKKCNDGHHEKPTNVSIMESEDNDINNICINHIDDNNDNNGVEKVTKNNDDKNDSIQSNKNISENSSQLNTSSSSDNLVIVENLDHEDGNNSINMEINSCNAVNEVLEKENIENNRIYDLRSLIIKANKECPFTIKKIEGDINSSNKIVSITTDDSISDENDSENITSHSSSNVSSKCNATDSEKLQQKVLDSEDIPKKDMFLDFSKLFIGNDNPTFEQFDNLIDDMLSGQEFEDELVRIQESELKRLKEKNKEWHAMYMSLMKQMIDMSSVIKMHKTDINTNPFARPHLITRTVGLQAMVSSTRQERLAPRRKIVRPSTQSEIHCIDITSDDDVPVDVGNNINGDSGTVDVGDNINGDSGTVDVGDNINGDSGTVDVGDNINGDSDVVDVGDNINADCGTVDVGDNINGDSGAVNVGDNINADCGPVDVENNINGNSGTVDVGDNINADCDLVNVENNINGDCVPVDVGDNINVDCGPIDINNVDNNSRLDTTEKSDVNISDNNVVNIVDDDVINISDDDDDDDNNDVDENEANDDNDDDDDVIIVVDPTDIMKPSTSKTVGNIIPKKQLILSNQLKSSTTLSKKAVPPAIPLNSVNDYTDTIDLTELDDEIDVPNTTAKSTEILQRPSVTIGLLPGSSSTKLTTNITTQIVPTSLTYVPHINVPSCSSSGNFIVRTTSATGSTQLPIASNLNVGDLPTTLRPYIFKNGKFVPVQISAISHKSIPQSITTSQLTRALQTLRPITTSQLPRPLPTVTCSTITPRPTRRLPTVSCLTPRPIRPLQPVPPAIPIFVTHPAPLPGIPNQRSCESWQKLPPAPKMNLIISTDVNKALVISWGMPVNKDTAKIVKYQIFAYQETAPEMPLEDTWKQIGQVTALPLPMACSLTQFKPGEKYHFAVRAVDIYGRIGPFSAARSVFLTPF